MNQKDFDALQKLINLCSNDNSDCGQKVIGKRARNVDSANHEILSGTTQEMVELSSNGNILTIASASALLENLGTVTTYYISLVASLASSQESHEHQQIFLYYYLILLRKVLRYAFTTVDTPTTTLDDILTLLLRTWKQLKDSATSLGHSFVELSLEFIDNYINVSSGLNYSLVNETFSSVFRVISKEMRALCINTDAVDDKNSSFFISGEYTSLEQSGLLFLHLSSISRALLVLCPRYPENEQAIACGYIDSVNGMFAQLQAHLTTHLSQSPYSLHYLFVNVLSENDDNLFSCLLRWLELDRLLVNSDTTYPSVLALRTSFVARHLNSQVWFGLFIHFIVQYDAETLLDLLIGPDTSLLCLEYFLKFLKANDYSEFTLKSSCTVLENIVQSVFRHNKPVHKSANDRARVLVLCEQHIVKESHSKHVIDFKPTLQVHGEEWLAHPGDSCVEEDSIDDADVFSTALLQEFLVSSIEMLERKGKMNLLPFSPTTLCKRIAQFLAR